MSEEEEVDLKIKYQDEVRDLYSIPVDIPNTQLMGEVFLEFFPACKLKLPEEKSLSLSQSRFTLKKFMQRRKENKEPVVRAVLKLDENMKVGSKMDEEEREKMCVEVEELKEDIEGLKKKLSEKCSSNKGLKKELSKKNRRIEELRERNNELDSENCILKKGLEKEKLEKEAALSESLGIQKRLKMREMVQVRQREYNRENEKRTNFFFGKLTVAENLANQLKANHARRLLIVYGRSGIKRSGLYDDVISIVKSAKIKVCELSGIMANNPRIASVEKGIKLCRLYKIDFILAVGGGSVIDCAKAISAGSYYDGHVWNLFAKASNDDTFIKIEDAIPLGCVKTLAGPMTETNDVCVLGNRVAQRKYAYWSDLIVPKFAICDPQWTCSVNEVFTKGGAVSVFVHLMEEYFFGLNIVCSQHDVIEAMKTVVEYLPLVVNDPKDYDGRSILMRVGTTLGKWCSMGNKEYDWGCHWIGNEVSAMYGNTSHGIILSCVTVGWLEHLVKTNATSDVKMICLLGKKVFGVDGNFNQDHAFETVKAYEKWLHKDSAVPTKFTEVIPAFSQEDCEKCAKRLIGHFGFCGNCRKLSEDEVLSILKCRI